MKRIFLLVMFLGGLLLSYQQAHAQQPTFSCTGGVGYLFQTTTTDIYTVNLLTGATTLQASDVLGTTNGEINGVGYNVKDNYIWGHRAGTNQLARIGSDFSVQTFPVPGLPTTQAQSLYIGDINSDGVIYLYNNNTSPGSITRVDLNPSSPTYLTLLPNLSTTATNILDWAFSPVDGNLYAISSDNTFHLYRFNPVTGARTDLGAITGGGIQVDNPGAIFGAAYMDERGTLYVSANATGRLYSIQNPHLGALTAVFLGSGPASSANDGAKCPLASVLPDPPAFTCSGSGQGYLFQDAATDVYVVNITTGATTLAATDILGTTGNTQVNAVGYNRTDNYIWGFRRGSNQVVRIGSDWTAQTFPIAGLPANGDYYIGDVSSTGVLYLYDGNASPTLIYRVDVNPASPTYLQALPTLTTPASNLTDWAFSPIDGKLYALDNTTLNLYSFDPATGARTIIGAVTGGGISTGTFGAAYMDGDGNLYVSKNETGQIFRIVNPHSGGLVAALLSTGPTSTLNDGARCPLTPVVAAPPTFACTENSGYLFQDDPTDAYIVNLSTGATTLAKDNLLGNTNAQINAVGYNVTDNYLWGFHRGTNQVVRIAGDWSVQTYPIVGLPVTGDFFVGDVSSTGVLYLYNNQAFPTSIYRVDVNPASPTYLQLLPTLTTSNSNLTDWAFSTIDGKLYAVDNTDLSLYRFDPASGARTTVGTLTGGGITAGSTYGAAYMDGEGSLYVSNNGTGHIFKIASPDTGGTTASLFAVGPSSTLNDGARCPTGDIIGSGVVLSGTVHSDPDGGAISGSGTNAGGTLYTTLLDNTTTPIATTAVAASGTYTFSNVIPGNYSVLLGTTPNASTASLPANYVNTNEGLTPAGDGTVNGIIPVTVAAADITGVDFAIEQLPTATPATVPSQPNPGGTTTVDISAQFTGTDPDGTVAELFFPSFPSNTTTITIAGTPYNSGNFPGAGVTVPTGSTVLLDPVDGAVTAVIPFDVIDNAGKKSPSAANVTVPFTAQPVYTLSGTVFSDPDGAAINGTGTNAGGLFANLANTGNNVVATAPIAANGTYSIPGVLPGSYTVVLSTTQGTVGSPVPSASLTTNYVNTNEGLIPAGDGTVNGIIPVTVAAANVTGVDFAIEQLPTATPATVPSQPNPGGTTAVDISAQFTGTDPDGTIAELFFPSFPSNSTTITIAGTPHNSGNFPVAGVTVPTGSTVLLDPVDGAVTAVIPFEVIDNAGKKSPTPANVTVPFTARPVYTLSGTVFNDPDGGAISGTGTDAGGLFANLAATGNNVVATAPIAANGTYSIPGVLPGSYTVVLSTTQGTVGSPVPSASLPTNYVNTNEGLTPAGDGTVNGIIPVTVAAADITGVDFAIQQTPEAVSVTIPTQINPGGTNTVDVTSYFTGADPDGSVTHKRFRSFPANLTTFVIDGTSYNSSNFPPPPGVTTPLESPVLIDPTDAATTVVIPYSLVDNGGAESPTANVTVPFNPLPVTLVSFTVKATGGSVENQTAVLNWSTTAETNSDRFEIEHSSEGKTWTVIGSTLAKGESSALVNYEFTHANPGEGENLYRLKMIDKDETYAYSRIRSVHFDLAVKISMYPNPTSDKITILINDLSTVERIQIIDLTGRIVYDKAKQGTLNLDSLLDVKSLPAGVYVLRISGTNGLISLFKVVKH
jgi:hypothetical protein